MRIVLACLLVGCAGDDSMAGSSTSGEETTESPESSSSTGEPLPEVDFEMDIQPLFNTRCTCHLQGASGTMTAPFMTLNPDISHGEIVNVPAEQVALDRVEPSDLEASYLWHKLEGTHLDVGGSGLRMPQTGPLDDAELELVRAWILSGAMP